MGKKMFVLIVVLMSVSLIGIIAVQVYWIDNTLESNKEQFRNDVAKSLGSASEKINDREETEFERKIETLLINSKITADNAEIKNYLFQQIDTIKNERFTFGTTILEENFKIPTDFLDNDSIIFKRLTGKKDFFQRKYIKGTENQFSFTDQNRFSITERLSQLEKEQFKNIFRDINNRKPINQRLTNTALTTILKKEFRKNDINLDFKYGVYGKDNLATNLKSGYYTIKTKNSFSYPLFYDTDGNVEYTLYVTFPQKNKHILGDLSSILLLSLFFILIIILAFSGSLYQLIRQKKISAIKTDFINNMTHEFKTPIATINLALDAIKNPKILNDNEKVMRYVKMIRDENKRMHSQVENVLRISRLEKNQTEIVKEAVDMHDIIDDAVNHVQLIVNDKQGTLKTHLEAISSDISGNQFHLINVVVNILENAIKYSEAPPDIDVFTESTNNYFIVKVRDKGIGMSKNVQKHVFDKFYREQGGNVHNVKGHGLGLAYVKEIVESHHGTAFVESERGKGSTFTVKLPLI
mgnify:CR=1 FL=1